MNVDNPDPKINLGTQRFPQFTASESSLIQDGVVRKDMNAGLFKLTAKFISHHYPRMEEHFPVDTWAAKVYYHYHNNDDLWQIVNRDAFGVLRPYSPDVNPSVGSYSDQRLVKKGSYQHEYNILMPAYIEAQNKFTRKTFVEPGLHLYQGKYYAHAQGLYVRAVYYKDGLRIYDELRNQYSDQILEYHPEQRMYVLGSISDKLESRYVAQYKYDSVTRQYGYISNKLVDFLGADSRPIFREDNKSKTHGIFYNQKVGLLEGYPIGAQERKKRYGEKKEMDALSEAIKENFDVSSLNDAKKIIRLKFNGLGEALLSENNDQIGLSDYESLLRSAIARVLIGSGYSDINIKSLLAGVSPIPELGDISTPGRLLGVATRIAIEMDRDRGEFKGSTYPIQEMNYRLLSTSRYQIDQGRLIDSYPDSLRYLTCRYTNMLLGDKWSKINYRLSIPAILKYIGVDDEHNTPLIQTHYLDKLADTLSKDYKREYVYPENAQNITDNDYLLTAPILPGIFAIPRPDIHDYTKELRRKIKDDAFFCGKAITKLEELGNDYSQSDLKKKEDVILHATYKRFGGTKPSPSDSDIAVILIPTLEEWEKQANEAKQAAHTQWFQQEIIAGLSATPNPVGMGGVSIVGGVQAIEQGKTLAGIAAILGGLGMLAAPIVPVSVPLLMSSTGLQIGDAVKEHNTHELKQGLYSLMGLLGGVAGILPSAKGMFTDTTSTKDLTVPVLNTNGYKAIPIITSTGEHAYEIPYNERYITLKKQPHSDLYQGHYSDTGLSAPGTYTKVEDGFFEKIGLKGGADKNEDTPSSSGEGKKGSFDKEENVVAWPKGKVFNTPESADPETLNTTRIVTADKLFQRLKAIEQLRIEELEGNGPETLELYEAIKDEIRINPGKNGVFNVEVEFISKDNDNLLLKMDLIPKEKKMVFLHRNKAGLPSIYISDIVRNVYLDLDEGVRFVPEIIVNSTIENNGANNCIGDYKLAERLNKNEFVRNFLRETQNGRSSMRVANEQGQEIYDLKEITKDAVGRYSVSFELHPKDDPGPLYHALPKRTQPRYGPNVRLIKFKEPKESNKCALC
ncbi:MAG: DUF4765 family protein [Candidatus Thiodiazotropha sp. (ex Lucinoma aequizonata)]|nr:DUF4765 family protein [Candidatus Thiodiazotropha sp. (ex Lucinoma aequizonata)]MCU7887289.1 DUF4765 family protein [Candidatus Thiodiazotropha sp. (ex Lucinoma aequizonata)]